MSLKNEFVQMVERLDKICNIAPIENIFLPPFYEGGQPKDEQFMAVSLTSGATGICYLLLPDEARPDYQARAPGDFAGKYPQEFVPAFGGGKPVEEMIAMACINAICQQAMTELSIPLDHVTDPFGLLAPGPGDIIGMVGLFGGLTARIKKTGAQLIVIEKDEALIGQGRSFQVSADAAELAKCNKVLCTGTTVLNNSLDDILANLSPGTFVSVVGPTVGYFPDPLFARGVDVAGGRVVADSREFLLRLAGKKRWTDSTQKICFQKKTYQSLFDR
jgi:uncharacterized protein (DUF4213/DUF364 family)